MIDMKNANQAFREYIKPYNPKEEKIKIKIAHTIRTAKLARKLAQDLKLSKEDCNLAELIGLLHDIGRFEQIRRFHTFFDKQSINHGMFGADLLFKEGLIRSFVEDSSYDRIIEKAIRNHNRDQIEEGLSERELLHAKIIRDSDKTDILHLIPCEDRKELYGIEAKCQVMTQEVYQDFLENPDHTIDYSHIKSGVDLMTVHLLFVFDFNYEYGLRVIKNNHYLEKIVEIIDFEKEETKKRIQQVYEVAKQQVEKRIQNKKQIKAKKDVPTWQKNY